MKTTLTKEREIAVACLFFLSWDGCPGALDGSDGHKKRVSNLATTNPLRRKSLKLTEELDLF